MLDALNKKKLKLEENKNNMSVNLTQPMKNKTALQHT
jgi:hypothetical protein